jgi:UDP-N-acetylmuramoylalanine--D-glutamate ligase
VPVRDMRAGLTSFRSGRHRLELVATAGGVRYVNDSKATNPDALARALESFPELVGRRIILIAGGLDKGLDLTSVAPLLATRVKVAFLVGNCRERLAKQWDEVVSCEVFSAFPAAVEAALRFAVPGDVVLLSPGCASMDMFANYMERGAVFTDLVRKRVKQ